MIDLTACFKCRTDGTLPRKPTYLWAKTMPLCTYHMDAYLLSPGMAEHMEEIVDDARG